MQELVFPADVLAHKVSEIGLAQGADFNAFRNSDSSVPSAELISG
jgi:hypothetical protein